MRTLSFNVRRKVVTTLLAYDECDVWYYKDRDRYEVTPNAMLTAEPQNRVLVATYYQKDFFKNDEERIALYQAYEKAYKPLYSLQLEEDKWGTNL